MSDSDDSSDYDRRNRKAKRGNIPKSYANKPQRNDSNDDYERFHRKKKKRRVQRTPPSSDDDIPIKKVPIKKRIKQTEHKRDDENMSRTPKPIKRSKIPTKRKKKVRKIQSQKVDLRIDKKNEKKQKKLPKSIDRVKKKKKRKKVKAMTPKVKKLKTPTPQKTFPTPKKRNKRKLRKARTMTETDMNINRDALFGDDDTKYNIGNTIDLSEYVLDSKMRDQIKANKNATHGGFKVKINYRYRLDDNRIGTCRFVGYPLFAQTSEQYVGLVIEYNGKGENDGSVQNKAYFRCRDGKGLFVRPHNLIENLGMNTRQLTKKEIKGSAEIHEVMKDIKAGIRREPKVEILKSVKVKRRRKIKTKRKPLKQRSKTVTNLGDKGKWKPPEWIHYNDIDKDHGYDFLSDKPFHSKEYLEKHKFKNKPVSQTSATAKNNY